MRILLINTFYYPNEHGGAEMSVRYLAETLVKLGHDVTVICLNTGLESYEKYNGVKIRRIKIKNIYLPNSDTENKAGASKFFWHLNDSYNFLGKSDIGKLINEIAPDVIHTNNISGFSVSIWDVAKKKKIPVIHTTRDFYLLCPKTTMMSNGVSCEARCSSCKMLSMPRKILSNNSVTHVIGISNFILDKHLNYEYFKNIPSSIIHNSYDIADVKYRSPEDTLVLGFIGRLAPSKGVELLIDAFKSIFRKDQKVVLKIAGNGSQDYVMHLKHLAAGLPVNFLGRCAPESFFPSIDATVVPSIWNEPLGRVVIESMAYGKPVIATPVGGIPELFNSDQGILCERVDVDCMATALLQMTKMLRVDSKALHESCLNRAAQFTGKFVAESYLNVFDKVLKSSSACL
ncbi:glycosyltransferase family 4 protein [Methylobacillus methanolivorans]|uniref:Glycosyltransferase family 4 protein n=1 Tax=Methylobacillus methanolivorans TaxID=1848927 RepID=A0ABW8GH21_9PROT